MIKKIEKEICFFDGKKISIDLDIPLRRVIEVDHERDEFLTDIITNQIVSG